MKNYRIIKGKKISVNQLASYSRQFTVKNTTKTISPKIDHKLYYNGDMSKAITNPFTGHKFIPTNPHQIPLDRGNATITAYEWVEPVGKLWKHERYKQPQPLHKKRYVKEWIKAVKYPARLSDLYVFYILQEKRKEWISEFPDCTIKPLNRIAYMEKLVEHKTAKWERKHPKPMDMFAEEVEKWKQERETAIERIRDFVVSVYDRLLLTGRFVLNKENSATYQEEKIAEIKDINGEGHKINELPKDSKLMKKAQKIVDETKYKRNNLVCGNLRDHKHKTGRIILPQAA